MSLGKTRKNECLVSIFAFMVRKLNREALHKPDPTL